MATLGGPDERPGDEDAANDARRRAVVRSGVKIIGVTVVVQATWSALTTESAFLAFLGWLVALTFALSVLVS